MGGHGDAGAGARRALPGRRRWRNLAMPGSANFVGEFYILNGVFETKIAFALIAAIGIALAAFYALRLYQRTMHNRLPEGAESREIDAPRGRRAGAARRADRRPGALSGADPRRAARPRWSTRTRGVDGRPTARDRCEGDARRLRRRSRRRLDRLRAGREAMTDFNAPDIDYGGTLADHRARPPGLVRHPARRADRRQPATRRRSSSRSSGSATLAAAAGLLIWQWGEREGPGRRRPAARRPLDRRRADRDRARRRS